MVKFKHNLPNLNSVLAFEASGRHKNFTEAASELNVTRVAVSQQVRSLEERLGIKLFERGGRRLRLTDAGREYHRSVSASFENLLVATQSVSQRRNDLSVSIAASSAFSTYWLMNKIGRFQESHPSYDVHLVVSESSWRESNVEELLADEVDMFVRYGELMESKRDEVVLFEDAILPVCSPGYLETVDRPATPQDLGNHRLLHLEGPYAEVHKWPNWFADQGIDPDTMNDGGRTTLNTYTAIVQSAMDGHGIALLSVPLLEAQIAVGQLTLALEEPVTRWQSFYLSTSKGRLSTPAVSKLRAMLLDQARNQRY